MVLNPTGKQGKCLPEPREHKLKKVFSLQGVPSTKDLHTLWGSLERFLTYSRSVIQRRCEDRANRTITRTDSLSHKHLYTSTELWKSQSLASQVLLKSNPITLQCQSLWLQSEVICRLAQFLGDRHGKCLGLRGPSYKRGTHVLELQGERVNSVL
ncbi:hypothetical protein DPX16_11781 [Anabarilius grahami]|uniref:Uncharacterized protein n=1 Tax=Anabarilius grahami TaxID=495550 RepID=A0A3N0Z831_ANAGA|nr:hypothetical protein DPX16_11781 [Anabarilius grahami]